MAVEIKVDINELDKQAVRMRNSLELYRTDLNSIYKDCLYQIDKVWKSNENKEYLRKFELHLKDMDKMGTLIEEYICVLEKASSEYKSAIENASSSG